MKHEWSLGERPPPSPLGSIGDACSSTALNSPACSSIRAGTRGYIPRKRPKAGLKARLDHRSKPEKQNPGRIPSGRGGSGVHRTIMVSNRPDVKPFSYTEEILDQLELSLSPERLMTYRDAVGGDRKRAIQLYDWNTAVSAGFYGPLQGLEVALRNAMHSRLAELYGSAWYDNPATGLDRGALERVASAKSGLAQDRRKNPSQVVAALSFGFWISLLGPGGRIEAGRKANYQMKLWRPALRQAFPHREILNRRQAHHPLNSLRILRNRIAHHEPIFMRNLATDHHRILDVAGWISPTTRVWINHHSAVPSLLESTPGR